MFLWAVELADDRVGGELENFGDVGEIDLRIGPLGEAQEGGAFLSGELVGGVSFCGGRR